MRFIAYFFLTVCFLSVAELMLLVRASEAVGFPPTLALCVLTGIVGGALVRHQGLQTLGRVQKEMASGRIPAAEILEGIVLLVTGALLCVPGFITDVLGGLMLVPPLRRRLAAWIKTKAAAHVKVHAMGPNPFQAVRESEIRDVECEEKPPGGE